MNVLPVACVGTRKSRSIKVGDEKMLTVVTYAFCIHGSYYYYYYYYKHRTRSTQ